LLNQAREFLNQQEYETAAAKAEEAIFKATRGDDTNTAMKAVLFAADCAAVEGADDC